MLALLNVLRAPSIRINIIKSTTIRTQRSIMEVSFSKNRVEVALQHLDYGQVIGGAWINPFAVTKMMEVSLVAFHELQKRTCKDIGIPHNNVYFARWQQVEYLPAFYDHEKLDFMDPYSYVQFVNRPHSVLCQVSKMGNASQILEGVAVDVQRKLPVVHGSCAVVNIDPSTLRPAPYHEKLKKHFSSENIIPLQLVTDKMSEKCKEKFEKPHSVAAHTQSSYMNAVEVDHNGHVGHASYTRLSFNCLADAFFRKVFNTMGSIFDYKMRRISLLFIKDCKMGDTVDATVWQDKNNLSVFKFHITKNDNLLCQTEIELFPLEFSGTSNSKL